MEDLKRSRNELEEERLSVKKDVEEKQAAIDVKRNGMKNVDEDIQKITYKIDQKQVNLHYRLLDQH